MGLVKTRRRSRGDRPTGDAEAAAREGGDDAAAQGPEGSGSTREVFVRPAPAVAL